MTRPSVSRPRGLLARLKRRRKPFAEIRAEHEQAWHERLRRAGS